MTTTLFSLRILLALPKKNEDKAQCPYQKTKTYDSRVKYPLNNLFIKSIFNYCALMWIFCSKKVLRKFMKDLHALCLKHSYLLTQCQWKVKTPYLEFLLIEVYKYLNGLSTWTWKTNDIFKYRKNTNNFRNIICLKIVEHNDKV